MSTPNSNWNVNILAVFVFALLIVLLTSLTKYFEARGAYFSFSAFLYSYPKPLPPGAIAIQVMIPLVTGGLLALLPPANAHQTALAAGALGAFLVIWPVASLWQQLEIVFTPIGERRGAFLIVFGLYVVAESFLCATGLRLVSTYQQWMRSRRADAPFSIAGELLDWKTSVKPALIALFSGVLTLVLGRVFSE